MTDPMELQRRYFAVQLQRFGEKPWLHGAMIQDCRYHLQMLEEAGSPGAFMERVKQTGNMVSTARADAADRYRNRAGIYEALGHERKAEEDRRRLEAVGSAGTHADLDRTLRGFEEGATQGAGENAALNAVVSVMEALFHLCTDEPGGSHWNRSLTRFSEYHRQLREADPGFSWQKLMTHRPYRDRLPFTDRQMAFLEAVYREVSGG